MARYREAAKKAETLSLEEAVKKYMRNGISIAIGGFTSMNRVPTAWFWETIRQGFTDLHVIDRHASNATFLLNAAKRIKIYETDWAGWGEMAGKLDANFERRYKEGHIFYEDHTHATMAFRFLAGALGIPFIPAYSGTGSDQLNLAYDRLAKEGLRDGKNPRIPLKKFVQMKDPFFGDGTVNLYPAARPELGIVHVSRAGPKGTAGWRGIGTVDKEMAFACDKFIVTCEEIVPEEELRRIPELNQIPYFTVDAIVEVPYGAHPSGVPFYYDYDMPFMMAAQAASRTEETMKAWMDEWVFGPANWNEYILKLGAQKLLDLKADELTGYSTRIRRGKKPAPKMFEPLSVARFGY